MFEGIPRIYDGSRPNGAAVVVELPAYDRRAVFANAPYVFNSTRYWHPLVNGYSGFTPASFDTAAVALRSFPDLPSLEMLRQRSVTHVVIHEGAFVGLHGRESLDRVARTGSLQLLAREGDISIYRFR